MGDERGEQEGATSGTESDGRYDNCEGTTPYGLVELEAFDELGDAETFGAGRIHD